MTAYVISVFHVYCLKLVAMQSQGITTVYGLLSLPDSQRTCGRGGGWEANDAVPPPRGVSRDSDIYIRVQRVLLLSAESTAVESVLPKTLMY